MQDARCGMQDAGCRMWDAGWMVQGTARTSFTDLGQDMVYTM